MIGVTTLAALVAFHGARADAQNAQNASEAQLETLNPRAFVHPTIVNNKWLPMKPGSHWVYEGTTVEDDGKEVPHSIEITITDLKKNIAGVCAVVSYDVDYSDGELVEAELAMFAQDDAGNVWNFGEYPEEYEDAKIIKAPTWIHGIEGARAGIMMQADPRLGTPSYSEGWGPAVDWTDRGAVHQAGLDVSVPAGSYKDVLVIEETTRSEVDARQYKYYATGVGNVQVRWNGTGEKSKETLDLVKVEQLGPEALAAAREKALKLEASGYKNSKNVYALTRPAIAPDTECR